MKNISRYAACFCVALAACGTAVAQNLTVEDYCDIHQNAPKSIKEMKPMPDGVSYLCVSADGKSIEKYSYKTGKFVETVFSVDNIKGDVKISEFDGYAISENGRYILLWNDTEGIYRYSFRAQHFVYDIARGTMKRVSEGGKQRGAVISHDGCMVAFMRDNNIFISNLDYDTEHPTGAMRRSSAFSIQCAGRPMIPLSLSSHSTRVRFPSITLTFIPDIATPWRSMPNIPENTYINILWPATTIRVFR